jgi:predicted nuclease with TOPRIM domain
MATKPLTLSGIVEPTTKAASDGLLQEWRREKQRLEEELLSLRRELDDARIQNEKLERSLRTLRKQLGPLHHALRAVFGEIELAVGEEEPAPVASSTSQPGASPSKWQAIRQKYSDSRIGDVVEILMLHGAMNQAQIAAALRTDASNVSKNIMPKIKALGLVVKNGDRWSLRD